MNEPQLTPAEPEAMMSKPLEDRPDTQIRRYTTSPDSNGNYDGFCEQADSTTVVFRVEKIGEERK